MNNRIRLRLASSQYIRYLVCIILISTQAPHTFSQSQNELLQHAIDERNQGNIQHSIELFKQHLEITPSSLRTKMELASSYFLIQEYSEAKSLALEVLEHQSLPLTVRNNINVFLAQIKQQQKHHGSVSFTQFHTVNVFSGHDSNANVAPSDNVIDIGTLAESSSRKASPFFGLSYDFSQYKPIKTSQKREASVYHYNGITLYSKDYSAFNRSDLIYLGTRAGIKYDITSKWFTKAKIAFTHIDLNNQKFAHDYLLSSQVGYLNNHSEIALQLSGNHKDYFRQTDHSKNGNILKQSLLYRYNLDEGSVFRFSISNQDANLQNDSYAYDGLLYNTSINVPFSQNMALRFGGSYAKNDYRGIQERYSKKRRDTVKKYQVQLNVLNIFQNIDSQFSYSYEERHSNNQINVYNKNLLMATLTYQFGPY